MGAFNSIDNACFHGISKVTMAHGNFKKVSDIVKGDLVKLENNEIGEIEITGYSVVTVLDKTDGGQTHETPQGKKHRTYKKFIQDQRGLF
jgi:hypothetical protein